MVKKNYDEINRLSSPNLANRNDLNVKQKAKLTERKNLFDKYGRLPFKDGFQKKKSNLSKLRMPYSDYELFKSEGVSSRSRSIAPGSKQRRQLKNLNDSEIHLDSAAEQVIENKGPSEMDKE